MEAQLASGLIRHSRISSWSIKKQTSSGGLSEGREILNARWFMQRQRHVIHQWLGSPKNHNASVLSLGGELCVLARGPVLSSLNSCEAGCRWKMSQVLGGDINHWRDWHIWEAERQKESRDGADNNHTLTLLSSDPVEKWERHRCPAQPSPSENIWNQTAQAGKEGYDATRDRCYDNKHSHFPETHIISCNLTSFSLISPNLCNVAPLVSYDLSE